MVLIGPGSGRVARRGLLPLVLALGLSLLPLAASPVAAQNVVLSTPYPAISVQPGATASFDISVRADERVRVDLSLQGVPDGWTAILRGGGREVSSVFADPAEPPQLTLDLDVPAEARPGTTTVRLVGTAGNEEASLALDVTVVTADSGSVALTTEVPAREGAADETFTYSLSLENDTPQQLTFELQAVGPEGWDVSVAPTGEADATSVTVDARGTQTLDVEASPPAQATEGDYPLAVQAVAGEHSVAVDLVARVTGRVEMDFTTVDGRLNATATAGNATQVEVLIVNTGTASLEALTLTGTGPSEWEVTFDPPEIAGVQPNGSGSATAIITPSGNAVAGDYLVELRAAGQGVDQALEVRVTVETSPIWGLVGLALIVLTLGAMVWVFRRYGRR
jgi:uncharacterized membrane protein